MTEPLPRFLKFGLVGLLGFGVDVGSLQLLLGAGLGPFLARMISISLAVIVTFLLNRGWAFNSGGKSSGGRGWRAELAAYVGVAAGSSLLNYAVYALMLLGVPGIRPLLALVVSSAAAMLASFAGYSGWVFKRRS